MLSFIKDERNPIYGDASTGTLFDVYVTGREEGGYRMDFSWRPQRALAVAFSDDGVAWTAPRATLPPDPVTGWEDQVNRNCVLKVGDRYLMWYTGQARGMSFIGLAESEDGLAFRRVGKEPVLIPERYWEGTSVMNPCVLFENGVFRMWYSAGETYEPNVLAYAESSDGIRWRKSPINPIFVKEPANDHEKDRIGGCQILPHEKLGYLLFYIGYRDVDTAFISVACSPDGVTRFRRFRGNPIVSPEKGSWDADACYKPSALYDAAKGGWRLWYNGRAGGTEYIGHAFAEGDFQESDFEE
ncbi:MAG: hypothetical protein J5849_07075 [Clostridia bacterium]|nr:hypothetical protein [Clostridia bacterium]